MIAHLRRYLRAWRWWWLDRPRWREPEVVELKPTPEMTEAMKGLGHAMTKLGDALTKAPRR